jgi:phosphoglycerate dehydrogenase-like enzyme
LTGKLIELKGKTLGIIGFGRIGRRVAEIASCIGMNIQYYDPYVAIQNKEFKKVELEELLKTSDVISIHVPLTNETYHMIGERELGLMKESVILVNTSRGAVICEKSLLKFLKDGKIYAFGTDVFEVEPLEASPLFDIKNTVLTPHIAPFTGEAFREMSIIAAEETAKILMGLSPNPTFIFKCEPPVKEEMK